MFSYPVNRSKILDFSLLLVKLNNSTRFSKVHLIYRLNLHLLDLYILSYRLNS